MANDETRYFRNNRVELRAAGFDPERMARQDAIITVASPYTNAHRCNNRVRRVADLLIDALGRHGGQGLIVGAPAVSDALTQGSPNASYSLPSRDLIADCIETGHRAHHADVGGDAPGSMPADATHIDQEGIRIPPTPFSDEVVAVLTDASRTPDERRGALDDQVRANDVVPIPLRVLVEKDFECLAPRDDEDGDAGALFPNPKAARNPP